ncbi:cytochrome P450 [Mycena galericulata]|nr:cytochrome P450 [Mycena galericulata]
MDTAPTLYSIVLLAILGGLLVSTLRKRHDLPPGPRGLPVLGNILQMPLKTPWVTYQAWAKTYGEIMHISILGQPIIFLTSSRAVTELLERRSAIYSDRPHLVFCGELVGYKESLPLCSYNEMFREQRKLASEVLGTRNSASWRPLEEEKLKEFLRDLLQDPRSFGNHIQRLIASIAFEITHGYTVRAPEDPMLLLAVEADHNFAQAVAPGAYLCDVLPTLRYIPEWTGVGFKREAKQFRRIMETLRDEPYNHVKAQLAQGTAKASLTASLIQREDNPTAERETLYKWTSASIFAGGADTSVSALETLFLALAMYPDVQRKAQEELERVVGPDRLPSFKDQPNLPYINALVLEVYRWNPVVPLAIPHRSVQDDVYNGFRIPAGSTVVANSWAIMHDEAVYPSPMEFIPERYLQQDSSGDGINPDPRKFAFGYGRRVCPGKLLAEDSVFIGAAMTLATFNLRRPQSALPVIYTSSLLSHPQPFECEITPRSRAAEALILPNSANED